MIRLPTSTTLFPYTTLFRSRRFGGATCDDKSAQIYARFDKNDWRIQPAEFYRFHDAEVNTLQVGYANHLDRKSGSAGMPRPNSYAVFCLKKKRTNSETTKSS